MNLDIRVVDIADQLKTETIPHVMLKREISENHLATPNLIPSDRSPYLILQSALGSDVSLADADWSRDLGAGVGQVAIPLFPYMLPEGAELLLKFGLQVGAVFGAMGRARNCERLIILVSSIFSRPDGKPGYCIYMGVALKEVSQ